MIYWLQLGGGGERRAWWRCIWGLKWRRMHGDLRQPAGTFIPSSPSVSGLQSVSPLLHTAAASSHVLTLFCSFSVSHQLYCRCTRLPKVYVNFSISRDASALRYRGIHLHANHTKRIHTVFTLVIGLLMYWFLFFIIQRQIKDTTGIKRTNPVWCDYGFSKDTSCGFQ